MAIVGLQIADQLSHERVVVASHHEADREARGVSRRGDEVESAKRAQRACALQVHVQNDSFTHH